MSASPKKLRRLVAGVTIGIVSVGALAVLPAGAQSTSGVNISGSSTVEPITSLVAENYAGKNPNVSVRVDGPGTGDGFKLLCADSIDIADASREIKSEESDVCKEKGITYTELPVGIDGLTIIANKASKLKCVDSAQIYGLFGPESDGTFATAQTLATELGSTNTPLPTSGSIKKFTPGPESGTYDSFIELSYKDEIETRLEEGKVTTVVDEEGEEVAKEPVVSDGQFPNDNDIVKRVTATKNGIGFLGYAFYSENKGDLKAISVLNSDTGTCVAPNTATIGNGTYVLSRTLYIYPNNAKVAANADVKSYLNFYITKKSLTATVKDAGYVPLPASTIATTISTWKALAG